MTDKMDFYDVLGVVVPGFLLITWGSLLFPHLAGRLLGLPMPEAVTVLALTAVAIFAGHLVQTVASLTERLLFKTWGGRPSDQILNGKASHYLPSDSVQRIRSKLGKGVGDEASCHSIFLYAMQLAETAQSTRCPRFNSLYGYHRSLLTTVAVATLLFVLSIAGGAASSLSVWGCVLGFAFISAVLVLIWIRTRQRGMYYAREVLLTAERVVDESRKGD